MAVGTGIAILCDVCGNVFAYGQTVKTARAAGRKRTGGVTIRGKDMCGRCWGKGKEFPKRVIQRRARKGE